MKIDLSYDGEFGPELQLVTPYAYYLHKQGLLGRTAGARDTKCLYYFSPDHEEKYDKRFFRSPREAMRSVLPNPDEHVARLDTSKWTPPPYKTQYANDRFRWTKEPLVIMNKFCTEWKMRTYNYIDVPALERLIRMLRDRFQIVYCRPGAGDIVNDGNRVRDLGDFKLLTRYPEVVTIQDLKRANPDLSFNTLQMMVFANCGKFISVQGGNSVLASYFGGVNIIYARRGLELEAGDYHHFSLYSGARICPCLDRGALLRCVRVLFAGKGDHVRDVVSRQFALYDAGVAARKARQQKERLKETARSKPLLISFLRKAGLLSDEDMADAS